MKSTLKWVLSATLICGLSVFTSCSNGQGDNPSPQAENNRKVFVAHARANMKDMAENINLTTWSMTSTFFSVFNEVVLYNDHFDKGITKILAEQVQKSYTPLSAEEAAETGKKYLATLDLTDMNYRFTLNLNVDNVEGGWEQSESESGCLELVIPDFMYYSDGLGMENTLPYGKFENIQTLKLALKANGNTTTIPSAMLTNDSVLVMLVLPEQFDMLVSVDKGGQWSQFLDTSLSLTFAQPEKGMAGGFAISGTANSNIEGVDATDVAFDISADPAQGTNHATFRFAHNGRQMLQLDMKMHGDLFGAIVNAAEYAKTSPFDKTNKEAWAKYYLRNSIQSIDDLTITMLDDLTTNLKVDDFMSFIKTCNGMDKARHNHADQQTIDSYVSQLNQIVSGRMTCQSLGQQIPMRLQTVRIGAYWYAVPALNFADENGYTALTDMLDKESVDYAFNIVDYTYPVAQQSIIVIKTLSESVEKMQRIVAKSMSN
jgi:hypothetical protein